MYHNNFLVWLLLITLTILLVSCASPNYQNFDLSSEPINLNTHEYLGDVIVVKEGYYFLGFIPFATNKEEFAKELMVEKTLWVFPEANAIYDMKTYLKEGVEFFDWTPRTIVRGKMAKRR